MLAAPDDGAVRWRKSSRSGGAGDCVEVAWFPETIGVRDSKDPDGPVLRFAVPAWLDFVASVASGEFDRPVA